MSPARGPRFRTAPAQRGRGAGRAVRTARGPRHRPEHARRPGAAGTRAGLEALVTAGFLASALAAARLMGAPSPFPVPSAASSPPPPHVGQVLGRARSGSPPAPRPAMPAPGGASGGVPAERRDGASAALPAGFGPLAAEVQFVGSGPGRAVLVLSGGRAVLLDGEAAAAAAMALRRLAEAGVGRLEALVATGAGGADPAGLVRVLDALPVGRVVEPGDGGTCPACGALTDAARRRGVPVVRAAGGTTLSVGRARLVWLWPPAGLGQPGETPPGPSLVRVEVGDVAVMLAGAFDPRDLERVVRLGEDLRAQVLEVPDSGLVGPAPAAFLRAVAPRVAVLHETPAVAADPATVAALAADGVAIVHGDAAGDVAVFTDGRRLALAFDPGPPPPLPGSVPDAALPAG